MKKFLSIRIWLPVVWIVLSFAILWLDFFSGPEIAFGYFFLIPVVAAARYSGGSWGLVFAISLPLIRLAFHFVWSDPMSFQNVLTNTMIRIVILVGAALLVDRVTRQAREIQVLRGCLPICSVCKKIRDTDQHWSRIETYITKHSKAKFSHTLCPDCGKRDYGEWMKEEASAPQSPPVPIVRK